MPRSPTADPPADSRLPKTLLIAINDFGGGGTQRVLSLLVPCWLREGIDCHLVTFADENEDAYPLPPGLRRTVLGRTGRSPGAARGVLANAGRILALRKAIAAARPDAVLSLIGRTNVLAIFAHAGLPGRLVVAERNDPARQSLGRGWDGLRRLLYRFADLVTANSPGACERLAAFVPRDRLALLPNPVRPVKLEAPAALPGPVLLAVGRLHRQKGYDLLLPALAGCETPWHLHVLGDGGERPALEGLTRELGLEGRVTWHGHVEDPGPYYRAADAFVMPSRYEGTPNALLEAMAHGLVCLVSDRVDGCRDVLVPEGSGLVFRLGGRASLRRALDRAADREMRRRLSAAASRAVAGRAPEAIARRWLTTLFAGSQ